MKFKVWSARDGDDVEFATEIEESYPEWAAERFADLYHSDGGGEWTHGEREFEVMDEAGETCTVEVTLEWSPDFTGRIK